ncbi:hypothetical protein HYALB_00006166 [Hymenoscyphus albidus]|uniref:Uncharacterized protein n=1 Tax=Hymenoscyphus albidus TaxID=595503 RepID=A0A9N9LHW1_9HELO|nr:hypothetical protein HYALB_00006166 [Hymenoscyphus albidus]
MTLDLNHRTEIQDRLSKDQGNCTTVSPPETDWASETFPSTSVVQRVDARDGKTQTFQTGPLLWGKNQGFIAPDRHEEIAA